MKLQIDQKADALYLRLDEARIVESEEVSPGIVLDYDAGSRVVAIEILNLSTRFPGLDPKTIQLETT